jgi:ABC-type nickel/cobalt efflux system permease component RcnA
MSPRVSIAVGYVVIAVGILAVLGSAAGARWILLVASLLLVVFGIRLLVGGRRSQRLDHAAHDSPRS